MQWLMACALFITGLAIYFPIIYIRKTDRMLKILERIELNTRDAVQPQPNEVVIARAARAE